MPPLRPCAVRARPPELCARWPLCGGSAYGLRPYLCTWQLGHPFQTVNRSHRREHSMRYTQLTGRRSENVRTHALHTQSTLYL